MSRAAVFALLVVLSSLAGVGLADAQTTTAFIANATVSPEQPAPGEQFTVRTTIQNSQQSGGGFEITDVYVRQRGSTDDVARVEDIGTLPPGSDVTVPLTASFDSPGTRELRVYVVGRNPSDEVVRLQYPVVVTVREGGPQVGISAEDAVVGTEGTVQVTAANGEDAAVRNVRVSLSGDAGIRDDTRVLATLPANRSQTFNFSVTPRSRTTRLEARVQYTTTSGSARTVTESVTLEADPLRESVQLDASVVGDGADPDVAVDVSNLGNAPLEDAVVELARDGSVLFRRPVADVAPDETRTARVNVSNVESGPMDVRVRYETGGRTGEATTRLNYSANPGRIELTGLDYETEEGRLHVSGTASNVGLGDVDSVVVRVVRTENVTPARPNPEYFVGSIPASDFSSFDLYAEVDPGTETVPIEVTYLANGAERTTRTELDVSDLNAQSPEEDDGGGLPMIPLVALAVVALLVIVGVGGYAYLRR
ncbi:NEW3 domain-containing protein [Halogeometricum luteum]|uniref:Alpha-galactosidase NEW3 domain-containing protein n=1 Tax=Halogeometricum luteum TaxID=2950537 RepID=A0ABU2FXE9_9EURY|nr:NEW3 domain-containing protein [Halogeometricum sp. S3BR5-2]MDS0293221.1 hypothetical protein [Halogeometricum sp. S3BR5-2]